MLRDLSWLKRVKILDKDGNLIDNNNPFPVISNEFFRVMWKSLTDFGKGSLTNVEIKGTNDEAYLQLEENADNSDDIDFSSSGDYTLSDDTKLEVIDGKLQLKGSGLTSQDWNFDTSGNYTYDSDKIEITGGVAKLKQSTDIYVQYHLNESSGTLVTDASSNSRNATAVNIEDGDWVSGKLNNALQFDGLNEYINCGDIANFERTQAFSVECWFKTSQSTSAGLIGRFDRNGAVYRGWRLGMGNGQIFFMMSNSTTYYGLVQTTNTFHDNSWHHVIVTYDGSSDMNNVKIYVDGVDEAYTVQKNTLTNTTLINHNCYIAVRDAYDHYFQGMLDEVVVYTKELSETEILLRYNSGTGTENEGFLEDNPTVVNNTGYVFTSFIQTFTETSTKTDSEIKYHVSSDDGVTWKYWNGSAWVVTDNTYAQANTSSVINSNINSLASSGTFKFRALLHTNEGKTTPELDTTTIALATAYSTDDNLHADTKDNSQISPDACLDWITLLITYLSPTNTDIKFLFSTDGRNNWLTWNGSEWTAPTDAIQRQYATSISDAQNNFSDLNLGNGTLDVRVFLKTDDSSVRPYISNINVISDAGYQTSGEFESNIYDSEYYSLDWRETSWQVVCPDGCSVIIKTRASNDSNIIGDYGAALINGEELPITGRYVQFKVEFTGNGADTPKLQEFDINYAYPNRTEYRP